MSRGRRHIVNASHGVQRGSRVADGQRRAKDAPGATEEGSTGGLHARVTATIREALDAGRWEIDEIARRLRVSPRTLQRALAAERLSSRQVLDEVRWSIAAPLVATTNIPLERIAERLGYAGGKAFRRAFRRWAGVAPVVLRRGGGPRSDE